MDALTQPITGSILVGLHTVLAAQCQGMRQASSPPAPALEESLQAAACPSCTLASVGSTGRMWPGLTHVATSLIPTSRLGNHL